MGGPVDASRRRSGAGIRRLSTFGVYSVSQGRVERSRGLEGRMMGFLSPVGAAGTGAMLRRGSSAGNDVTRYPASPPLRPALPGRFQQSLVILLLTHQALRTAARIHPPRADLMSSCEVRDCLIRRKSSTNPVISIEGAMNSPSGKRPAWKWAQRTAS